MAFTKGAFDAVAAVTIGEGVPPAGTWFVQHGSVVEGLDEQGDFYTITFVDAYGRYTASITLDVVTRNIFSEAAEI